jgi:hypothetical protein
MAPSSKYEERYLGDLADPVTDFPAVHFGQHQVEEHQVRLMGVELA